MNLRRFLIYAACLTLLFLAFSNNFVNKSAAVSLTVNQTPPPLPTPIMTISLQPKFTPVPSPPKLTITPNQPVVAPQRATGDSYQNTDNNQTVTPLPIDSSTPTPTPIKTPTPVRTQTPKSTPTNSPTDSESSKNGSWLPWIIAGILFVIVIFLLGRNSKD